MSARLLRSVAIVASLTMISVTSSVWAEQPADHNTVVLKNFHFGPASLSISAGETVTWTNMDEEPHTVVSDAGLFRSGALDEHESFSFKFDKPGTYGFICSIHPQMRGVIVVK